MAYPSTFTDLQTQVAAKLRLDATADAQKIKDYLNRAYAETCVETEALQTVGTMTLTANVDTYTLPSDTVRIKQMTVTSGSYTGRPLIPVSVEQILEWKASSVASGRVTHYTVMGLQQLIVYPAPSAADTVNVWYVKQPTALSSGSDVPVLPEPYATRCLENGACYEAALFAKDPDAGAYKAEFEMAKRLLRGHLRRLQGAGTMQFRVPGSKTLVPHDPATDIRWA